MTDAPFIDVPSSFLNDDVRRREVTSSRSRAKTLFVVARDDWSLHRQGYLDQQRHDEKVREAVRENLADLITEESVILSDGETIIKVPVRSLEEYRFRFDMDGRNHVGQGQGDSEPGDVIGRAAAQPGLGGKRGAGEGAGVDYYEADITVDDLAELVFANLGLPAPPHKNKPQLEHIVHEFRDVRRHGIMANIDRKRTLLAALRRTQRVTPGQLNISRDDLRYKTWEEEPHKQAHAVVLAMMDTSGSMGSFEKYIARSFFFWMVRFLRTRYRDVEILFLAHDTRAREVTEQQFFTKGESGGTRCSSVYSLALDIIAERYPGSRYNIYPFHFSDGDNFPSDNEPSVELMRQLIDASVATGYGEIVGQRHDQNGTLMSHFEQIDDDKFTSVTVRAKRDVYDALRAFFHGPPAGAVS